MLQGFITVIHSEKHKKSMCGIPGKPLHILSPMAAYFGSRKELQERNDCASKYLWLAFFFQPARRSKDEMLFRQWKFSCCYVKQGHTYRRYCINTLPSKMLTVEEEKILLRQKWNSKIHIGSEKVSLTTIELYEARCHQQI